LAVLVLGPYVPDLVSLQLLLAVRTTGSLSAASAQAAMTQQGASSRMRAMETQVGVALLTRTTQGSQLTTSGQLLAQWAETVIDAASVLEAGIVSLRIDRDGLLRVFASLTVAEHLMPRWLVALQTQRRAAGEPPAAIKLVATNSDAVLAAVTEGQAALGFVEGPGVPAGLRSRPIGRDQLQVVVAPQHPWARRRAPVPAAELAATALVSREPGSGTRRALTRALSAHLPRGTPLAAPVLELSSSAAVRGSIAAGVGPGVLSALTVADDISLGRLVVVDLADVDLRRTLRAVWAAGRQPPAGPARALLSLATRA